MQKRCVIAAGGTGGHLFPAQALADDLKGHDIDVMFLAKGLHDNRCFSKTQFQYLDVDAASFSKNPFALPRTLYKLASGIKQSLACLRAYRPDVVIGFGSYHTVPALAAAKLLSIPIILHEANSYPGKVNRLFSGGAAFNGVFFMAAAPFLRGPVKHVTMPLRPEFMGVKPNKEEALRSYGLLPEKKTIVIFGGSQGAKRINELMAQAVQFLPRDGFQYIHFTGEALHEEFARTYKTLGFTAYVASFENNMPRAYMAADLVICRSGASTIAELIHCQMPSILIPYPFAADDHQMKNASFVANEVHAASVLPEHALSADQLACAIMRMAEDASLQKMKENIRSYCARASQVNFTNAVVDMIRGCGP